MTSSQIRQSFLDFFAKQKHTIVPSSPLLPDSPGLLFTNAGMNQFVPIFLNERTPDVSRWPGARPASDTRAADTQKCIRAGGKHNDLDDVGWDTYHHTLFEMLGNWSFGDYFKRESLAWGWELLTQVWGIPAKRLFATVYSPDKSKHDPADFDQEAHDIWQNLFRAAGLDPAIHIVNGGKKDNFWMMGETGPCGPCSEIHINLLPSDDETAGRALVNTGSPRCIEIWNHVFIQFAAQADGTFAPLPARHVDTGMGFERVAGIHATTKGFTDFAPEPSNYNADLFTPLFAAITTLSGKNYGRTVPASREKVTEQERTDIAFRVLADHARAVSCAIADGILPGNDGRNYVIRRILRRGILYGRKDLNLETGFFAKLVPAVTASLGDIFPELKQQQPLIERVIRTEEENFGKTLDRGIALITEQMNAQHTAAQLLRAASGMNGEDIPRDLKDPVKTLINVLETDAFLRQVFTQALLPLVNLPEDTRVTREAVVHPGAAVAELLIPILSGATSETTVLRRRLLDAVNIIPGRVAFTLYDTFGFPLDMTQLLAAERGLTVDTQSFEREMETQRARARAAQKKEIITVAGDDTGDTNAKPTLFTGFDYTHTRNGQPPATQNATLIDVIENAGHTYLVFDRTPFYAEMGGQVGDTGTVTIGDTTLTITDTIKDKAGRHLHLLADTSARALPAGNRNTAATLSVDLERRRQIQRHHTATHLLHWALREVLGTHVRQAGSSVHPDYLRFDFAHFEQVKPGQLQKIEHHVNTRILENAPVSTTEVAHADIAARKDINQFFGDKYGDRVRVVQIGGAPGALDGYSMELCGGTHTAATGELGLVKITLESAIAAGTRRIEAVAGAPALALVAAHETLLKECGNRIQAGPPDLLQKLDTVLAAKADIEKKLKTHEQRAAATLAAKATPLPVAPPAATSPKTSPTTTEKVPAASQAPTVANAPALRQVSAIVEVETPDALRALGAQVIAKLGEGIVRLGAVFGEKATVVAFCSPAAIKAGHQAGKIVAELCAKLDGKGGGKPDFAMGGGKSPGKLAGVLKAES
ncbi:MAG: alanine--tRNA ligase [Opitutaceae bacterium]|jgi:alanyl-tRNA synthetase|nr:alanine--tRNA ligase [Opitutaceae bacterium]